jgi:redox-sensitive bicupin YhaK (pirin superfamily)
MASGQGMPDVVTFNTDATIYRTDLNKGQNIDFRIGDTRKIFVYITYGDLDINGTRLGTNDQARITSEKELLLCAHDDTDLILIDVPA